MVLTVSSALSSGTGLCCPRRQQNIFHQLDASVGASGPHDFAVRISAVRQRHIRVHRISRRVDDVGQRPSLAGDGAGSKGDLPDGASRIFFAVGLDGLMTDLPVGLKSVHPLREKYSAFAVGQIRCTTRRVPPHQRGVSRSSRTLGAGCDGRFRALRRMAREADGEVVWS